MLVRDAERDGRHHLTLAVNDARRKQLYFTLLDDNGYEVGGSAGEDRDANVESGYVKTLIDMDIDYPESIARRVNEVLEQLRQSDANVEYVVDVIGHGAAKYVQSWASLPEGGMVSDHALLDEGASDWNVSRPSPLRNRLWRIRSRSNRCICAGRTCRCRTR